MKFYKKILTAIKGGIIHILCGSILVKAMSFLASIVVINYIPKEEYAYLSYAVNIYSYLDFLSGLGIALALLKYASSTSDVNKKYALIKFSCIFSVCVDSFFVVLVLAITSIVKLPFPKAKYYILLLSVFQILVGLRNVLQVSLRAQNKNSEYALVGVINAVTVLIVGYFGVRLLDGTGYVIAQYSGVVLAIVYSLVIITFFFRRNPITQSAVVLDKQEISGMIRMGVSLMIANLFSGIMPINEKFLVDSIIMDEIISANFKVAGLLPQQLLMFSSAIVIYFFPIIAKERIDCSLWIKCRNIGIVTFCLILLVASIGVLLTPWFIRTLYGEKYLDSIGLSFVLWGMRAINAGIRVVPMNLLPALGKTKFNAICAIVSCILLTAVDYFLLKSIGISGVAYGAVIIYLLSGIAFWIYLYYVCHNNERVPSSNSINNPI